MSSDPEAAWQRGLTPMLLLGTLEAGPAHGYAMAQRLQAAGFSPLRGAQLYPVLLAFEDAGYVTVNWIPGDSGPARKTYELTETGRAHLADLRARWEAFADRAGRVVGVVGESSQAR